MKFRKKPVVIEAWHYDEENKARDLAQICGGHISLDLGQCAIIIHTLEGDHKATLGDWIIEGIEGEFYPCKPDIFEATYERVTE